MTDRLDFLAGGIEADSRLVKPGMVFVSTSKRFGVDHCRQAIANGAALIIAPPETRAFLELGGAVFKASANPNLDLANLASAYHAPLPEINVAVTGTNGKSSVVSLLRGMWRLRGKKAASIGTLGVDPDVTVEANLSKNASRLTTLDSLSFFKILSALKKASVDFVAFEASSIGIDQFRCHGLPLAAAGFTNLTPDHLDYHGSMEAYFAAKSKLFSVMLESGKTAVINLDSAYAEKLISIAREKKLRVLTYGVENAQADLSGKITELTPHGLRFDSRVFGKAYKDIFVPLAGSFQLENLSCALGLAIACGDDPERLIDDLPLLKPIKGRMERVASFNGATAFVDYAHTPDALRRSLLSLKACTSGKLWVLFGCGGDRDTTKRPLMGEIAVALADCVVITDDNPRFEDAAAIRREILKARDTKAVEIAGRKRAIIYAVSRLKEGDTLLVAGKGHETGQIIGNDVLPFDDSHEIKKAITECTR